MRFKDILAIVFSAEDDGAAFRAMDAVAGSSSAHRAALLLSAEPDPVYTVDGAMAGGMWAEVVEQVRADLKAEAKKITAALARFAQPTALRTALAPASMVGDVAAVHARHADLTIITAPQEKWPAGVRRVALEGALFGSGRPVLVIPPDWKGGAIGKRVVVAWNAKREAARALADALPLIEGASVVVLTVDAEVGQKGHGAAPGADIAAHLARHGLDVDVRNVDGLGRDEGDAIADEAAEFGADLIVMGAYGKSRLREMVFGGVTRRLLDRAPLPLLMSH